VGQSIFKGKGAIRSLIFAFVFYALIIAGFVKFIAWLVGY